MNANFIKLYLPEYLIGFVLSQTQSNSSMAKIGRNTFIGSLIYERLVKIPEDCHYIDRIPQGKKPLLINLAWIGGRNDKRINCKTAYYYIPSSVQRDLETKIEEFFNEVFFNVVDIAKEYTDLEYKQLIESFCERYKIDFSKNYDMLKKRHYRKRIAQNNCTAVPCENINY